MTIPRIWALRPTLDDGRTSHEQQLDSPMIQLDLCVSVGFNLANYTMYMIFMAFHGISWHSMAFHGNLSLGSLSLSLSLCRTLFRSPFATPTVSTAVGKAASGLGLPPEPTESCWTDAGLGHLLRSLPFFTPRPKTRMGVLLFFRIWKNVVI